MNCLMDQSKKIVRLRLIRARHIVLMTSGLLMQRYGSAAAELAAIPTMAKRDDKHLSLASIASAKAELDLTEASDAVLVWRDSEYCPDRLA